jgi:hypothetical protein
LPITPSVWVRFAKLAHAPQVLSLQAVEETIFERNWLDITPTTYRPACVLQSVTGASIV